MENRYFLDDSGYCSLTSAMAQRESIGHSTKTTRVRIMCCHAKQGFTLHYFSSLSCMNENPSWVLKEFSELLAGPVAAIYNSSLRQGNVPRIWRAAYVSPLPKKKPPEHIETDLRPISLTAVLCKQMEEFVVKWVWDIVQDRVDPNQYGSIKKSSTTHALVDLLHQCYTSTDASKQYARILLLDFSKAFDLINHDILLQKLASFGLPNILMKWIASFLTERTQKVKLCNTQSDWNYIHG